MADKTTTKSQASRGDIVEEGEGYVPPGGYTTTPGGYQVAGPPEAVESFIEREAEVIAAETPQVVGVSSKDDELIVRDPATGETYWKPGTPEQIETVRSAIGRGEGELPPMAYVPPSGVDYTRPPTGSIAATPRPDAGTVQVYNYRGKIIELATTALESLSKLVGEEQYQRAVELGLLPSGQYVHWSEFQANVPTVPDREGGQIATVDGQRVYIAGSTMRDKFGFETPEQYSKAQRRGEVYGPLAEQWGYIPAEPRARERYLKSLEPKEEAQPANTERLPDGRLVRSDDLERLGQTNPELYAIMTTQGYDAYYQAYENQLAEQEQAKELLEPYRISPSNNYHLMDALASGDPEVVAAAETLFSPQDIRLARIDIEREWGTEKYRPGAKETVEFIRRITPWKEERGETFRESVRSALSQIKAPAALLGAIPIVSASPIPLDDLALYLLIGGAAAYGAVRAAIDRGQAVNIPADAKKEIAAIRSKYGRDITTDDVLLLQPIKPSDARFAEEIRPVNAREAALTEEIRAAPDIFGSLGGIKEQIVPLTDVISMPSEQIKIPSTRAPKPGGFSRAPAQTPMDNTTLATISKVRGAIIGEPVNVRGATDYFNKYSEAGAAANKLAGTIDKTVINTSWGGLSGVVVVAPDPSLLPVLVTQQRNLPVPYTGSGGTLAPIPIDRIADEIAAKFRQGELSEDDYSEFSRALADYKAKKAILEAARKVYIQSIRPEPLKGGLNNSTLSAYLAYSLGRSLSFPGIYTAFSEAVKQATNTMQQSLVKGKTETAAEAEAQTAAQAALQEWTQTATQTALATKTATKTQLQTLARTLAKTAVKEAAIDTTMTSVASTSAATALAGTARIPRPKPGGGAGAVPAIPLPDGSYAWKQGMVWKFITPPFTQRKPRTLTKGSTPRGAIRTDGRTPQETIQIIGKLANNTPSLVTVDMGMTDAFIERRGRELTIFFSGKGDRTDVGRRIVSNTQGMSVDEEFSGVYSAELTSGIPAKKHRRPKRKPKTRRRNDFSDLTSMRGMKW